MAIFKVVEEVYKTEEDLRNLISYACNKSCCKRSQNIIMENNDIISNQFLYIQKCYGGDLRTRALHFIFSFEHDWEHWMDIDKVNRCGFLYTIFLRFAGHQYFHVVHNDKENLHIHFIVNPVNQNTLKIFHSSQVEYRMFLQEMAREIFYQYKLALQSVSYIDEKGRLRFGKEVSPFLYLNRTYSYDQLK